MPGNVIMKHTHTITPTLTPDPEHLETTMANLSLLDDFFESLGLKNNENWQVAQDVRLIEPSRIWLFGMAISIPGELRQEAQWSFRLDETSPGVLVLSINREILGARVSAPATIKQLAELPRDILCLQWDGYAYEKAPSLEGFTQLRALSLLGCSNLKNLQGLADLSPAALAPGTQLTSLELIGCESLEDLEPLAGLTDLVELALVYSKGLTDLKPLSTLLQLRSLDLRLSMTLENLQPLSSLIRLESLDLRGCDAIKDTRPVVQLPELHSLELGNAFLEALVEDQEQEARELLGDDCKAGNG